MPKVRKHIPDAQKQRKLIKEKFSKYVPGRITLQVLGTGAMGAPRSLYVFSDQSRYLFNCGEGTQRLAHEHKMKLAKLEHIFVTQSTWNNIGGLPGTALTIQDVGVPQITLHGPQGLDEIFTATRRFVILRDLNIEVVECNEKTMFEDNVMKVQYVPITKTNNVIKDNSEIVNKNIGKKNQTWYDSTLLKDVEDSIDYYAHERKIPFFIHKKKWPPYSESRRLFKSGLETTRLTQLTRSKDEAIVMCYVCKLQPRPGALSLDKCVKFGVPTGPLLGKLKMGETITLPSGSVIHSTDVCEPDDPGPVFLVVDCPSEEYLESFTSREEFKKHQQNADSDDLFAYLVVHFTPEHIMCHPEYKRWMSLFSPSTHHLNLNDSNTCMGSESVHRIQYKLNLLHNNFFPLLGDHGSKYKIEKLTNLTHKKSKMDEDTVSCTIPESISTTSNLSNELSKVNTFCNFHLRPKKGIDRSNELLIKPTKYVEETMFESGFVNELFKLRELLKQKKDMQIRVYPSFLFLGTGSCIPNKTRNTSGILYKLSENTNILLDCGEGTYGQLVRFYGTDKAKSVLVNLKAIFISHLHADHHIGLIGILQGRRKALNETNKSTAQKILLLAPKQIMTWLRFYDSYFENIAQEFELIPNDELLYDDETTYEETKTRLHYYLGMTDISTTHVRHCPNAFGIAFTSKDGHKICYSGDTMPSENLINLGNRCDLLIHEATMEDELEDEAVLKMHSTTSQAIEVGRNMNAKHILLTHFSQRYAKLPKFNDNFTDNVGIAFDNMQIRLDELPVLPLLYPALRVMFAEHYEELETKSLKRQLRLEKEESLENLSSTTSSKELKNEECSSNILRDVSVADNNETNETDSKPTENLSITPLSTTSCEVIDKTQSPELMQVVSCKEVASFEKTDKPEILGQSTLKLKNKPISCRQPSLEKHDVVSITPNVFKTCTKLNNDKREANVSAKKCLEKSIKTSKRIKTRNQTKPLKRSHCIETNTCKKITLSTKSNLDKPKKSSIDSNRNSAETTFKPKINSSFPSLHNDGKDSTLIRPYSSRDRPKMEERKSYSPTLRCRSPEKPKLSIPKINLTFGKRN